MEGKKYKGMSFFKEAPALPRSREESEIFRELERNRREEGLEDDFIQLAGGLEEKLPEQMDYSEESSSSAHEERGEEGGPSNGVDDGLRREVEMGSFASLIEEINARPENDRLRVLGLENKKFPRKRRPQKNAALIEESLEKCNVILNRLGSLHRDEYLGPRSGVPEERRKSKNGRRGAKKSGNWDEAENLKSDPLGPKPRYI